MARPSKLTPECLKRIREALRVGTTRKNAAQYGGIDETTFCRWMLRYADFASTVRETEARWQLDLERTITVSARGTIGPDGSFIPGNTADAKWLLERRRREDYGANVTLDLDREIAEILAQLAATGEAPAPRRAADAVNLPPA